MRTATRQTAKAESPKNTRRTRCFPAAGIADHAIRQHEKWGLSGRTGISVILALSLLCLLGPVSIAGHGRYLLSALSLISLVGAAACACGWLLLDRTPDIDPRSLRVIRNIRPAHKLSPGICRGNQVAG